ncbi:hypothetical protein EYF80_000102 [Liparis tanakae]|uniref:Uncharacterized protein n=1 Tax=Liparis tanakae TaxID=230148 RepID=A0A4Z2JGS3_9TELE|nr:hypothetical protein EYF80_000102 [Liparis tanakae]
MAFGEVRPIGRRHRPALRLLVGEGTRLSGGIHSRLWVERRLMMVPLLPVGEPLPGEMDDFSTVSHEEHLWESTISQCSAVQCSPTILTKVERPAAQDRALAAQQDRRRGAQSNLTFLPPATAKKHRERK